MPTVRPPRQKTNLQGKIFTARDGRRYRMDGTTMIPLDPPQAGKTKAATPSSTVSTRAAAEPTTQFLVTQAMLAAPNRIQYADKNNLRVPVLRLPNGQLCIALARTGTNLVTDCGPIDLMALQAQYNPKAPAKFGRIPAASVMHYRKTKEKQSLQPAGRTKDADTDAELIYALVSATLMTGEEARTALGLDSVTTPATPEGRLKAIGFDDLTIKAVMTPAAAIIRNLPPMIPPPVKDRKRRISHLDDPKL